MLDRGDAGARHGRIAPSKIEIKRFLAADVQVQVDPLRGLIHSRGKGHVPYRFVEGHFPGEPCFCPRWRSVL